MELVVKNPPADAWDSGDAGSILRLGRSPGGGNGNPLQYSCLDNPTDREAWWATVHWITNRNTKNVFSWSCLWYFIFDLYHFFLYFSFKIVPKIHFKVNHSFFWSTVFSFLIYNAFINFHVVFNLLKISSPLLCWCQIFFLLRKQVHFWTVWSHFFLTFISSYK